MWGLKRIEAAVERLWPSTSCGSSTSRLFVDATGWLPAIKEIDLPLAVKPFEPVMEGSPQGFGFAQVGGENFKGVVNSNLYRLWEKGGSVAAFLNAVEAELHPALIDDMNSASKAITQSSIRQDSFIGANFWLSLYGDPDEQAEARRRLSVLTDLQQASYMAVYRRNATFRKLGIPVEVGF